MKWFHHRLQDIVSVEGCFLIIWQGELNIVILILTDIAKLQNIHCSGTKLSRYHVSYKRAIWLTCLI